MSHPTSPWTAPSLALALTLAAPLPGAADQESPDPPGTAVPAAPQAAPPAPDTPRASRPAVPPAPAAPRPVPRAGYLGVVLEDVSAEDVERLDLPGERGARIREVVDGSPAEEAGLRAGDVILSWRGESVFSAAELERLVRETPPGRQVRVELVRDGNRTRLTVETGEHEAEIGRFVPGRMSPEMRAEIRERMRDARGQLEGLGARMEGLDVRLERAFEQMPDSIPMVLERLPLDPRGPERARLGVRLQPLTPGLAEYFGLGDRSGALVAEVRDGSPADRAGLRAGDVLLSVAGEEVRRPRDAARAVRDAPGEVPVRVLRRGEERSFTVRLGKPGDEGDSSGPERRRR